MYQALLVDDEKLILNSLALGFNWQENGFEVVATSNNSQEALKMIEFIRPDIIFTDIKMPGINGIELMRKVHQFLPQALFVVISGYAEFSYARQAMEVGALGYCLKPLEDEEIEEVLSRAKEILDARSLVTQSAFSQILKSPTQENVSSFLDSISSGISPNHRLHIAIAWGDASSLLIGNMCFSSVNLSEHCNLYLISSSGSYLETIPFRRMLLNAASEGKLTSFAYQETSDPVDFFIHDLNNLACAALSHFIRPENITLGEATPLDFHANPAWMEELTLSAHKNRTMDVLNLLGALQEPYSISLTEALHIYNLCDALLARAIPGHYESPLLHAFQLAERYPSLKEMLRDLSRQLHQNHDAVNMDMVRNKTFREVLEYVNGHFTQPISFQSLCETHCINASYLSQLFKKELGITFTAYLTHLRINYAKELLSTTNLRISEISERVGYDYYFNFTKLFKKETGFTPKQYRDEVHNDP